MPILINDFSWRQTEGLVIIRVPLKNIPHTKVDIFTSEIYVKVHYPPYLFECCLYERINEDESRCTLVEGEAVFELVKYENKTWPFLTKDVSKQELIEIKKKSIDLAHHKSSEKTKHLKEVKSKRRRDCCSTQVSLDGDMNKLIQQKKESVKTAALEEIAKWKEKETDRDFLPTPISKADAKLKSIRGKKLAESGYKNKENEIFSDLEIDRDRSMTDDKQKKEAEEVEDTNPPPRVSSRIEVDFTFRAFPTPCRESKLNEEHEWLKKMADARRKTGFVAEDLRPEENDPQWLLQKGKCFHEVGNYLGAVLAFSHALKTWTKIPELWVARSESQLSLGNYRKVLRDTSEALDLLRPHVTANADLRFTSHYNRGRALLELGQPEPALSDFVEALELRPQREDLHNLMDRAEVDIERMREERGNERAGESVRKEEIIEPEDLAN